MAKKGTIGAKIVLEGEAQYRQALKNIKSAQAELRSEMKLSQTQFKGNANSLEALASKQTVLSKQIEQSGKKVKVYNDAVNDATKKQAEAKKILDDLKASQKASDEEIAKAQKDYDAITNKVNQYQSSLNYAEAELNEFKDELRKTEGYMAEASASMNGCAKSIDEFGNELKKTEDETSVFGDVLKANLASEAVMGAIKTLVNGIKTIATAAIETGMEFESSMDKVAALSGATGKDLDSLTEKAKDMGASTMFSASEAADALGYMALAGWKTSDMLEGIEPILNLAAAADMDLAEASDIVTDYLTAFGLTAKDAAKFSDQLAYAMANSNTNVTQLGEAYKNCAATASSLGYSVEDVTAVLMTMANAGVKGGEAGTGLSSIMTRLATNTKECGDILKEYGVDIYDAEGNMNSLSSILSGLSSVWGTLSQQEQATLAKTIAGVNQYSKLQTIMNGLSDAAKEGGQSFYDYANALESCDGSASEMADTVQDNLSGKLKILESALDAVKVSVYEVFDDSLKEGVDEAANALTRLNKSVTSGKLNVSLNKMAQSLNKFISGAVDLGEKVLPILIDGLSWIMDNAGVIAAGISGVVTAQAAIGITQGIMAAVASWRAYKLANESATVAQWALNAAMDANPVGAIVVAIEAVVAALAGLTYWLYSSSEGYGEAAQELKELNEATRQNLQETESSVKSRKEARESLEAEGTVAASLVDRLDELQKKSSLTTAEQAEMSSIISQLNDAYPDLNLQIDKNGKLIGKTTDEIRDQISATLELYKVKAAEADLVDIASDIYQTEKDLANNREKLLQAQTEFQTKYGKSYEQFQREMANASISNSNGTRNSQAYFEYQQMKQLEDAIKSGEDTLGDLNDEYQATYDYISGNTDAVKENSEAYAGLKDALGDTAEGYKDLSSEVQENMTTLATSVSESVENSMDAFKKFDAGTKVSKKELIKNLDSQIKGITKWSENMQTLAARGVSEGLLEELAKLGPEGANYVQAFVNMSDKELADYDKKYQDYLSLPDQTSKEIAQTYGDAARESTDAMADGIQEGTAEINQAVAAVGTETKGTLDQVFAKDEFKKYGINIVQGAADGMLGNESTATNAASKLAKDIMAKFAATLGIQSPSKEFKKFGKFTIEGYTDGIEKNGYLVKNATASLGKKALAGIQQELVGSELAVAASPMTIDVANSAGSNNDIIRALNTLGNVVKTSSVNNYTVNGITYDDGSNVANAIGQLIKAAQVERRM